MRAWRLGQPNHAKKKTPRILFANQHSRLKTPPPHRRNSQEDNNKILYPGQWHSWTSLGAALGSISSQSHHTPSSADNDTCDTCEGGGVGANANANNAYSGGGTGQATGGGGLQQTTYSAPSPSPWSSTSGAGGDGTLVNGAMNNLPLVGLSAGPTVPLGSATTHPSTPGGKRYHPEPALAVLFDRYGGVDTALQVLTRTTAQNGNDPVMWSDLGNAHRVKGDSDKAIECFESALRLQPHPDFFLNLGGVRFVLGEVDEAIRLFTLGLQMNPRHVLLQFSMGNAYAMQGRKEEAARSFEATLRIQPDFAAAEQYLRTLRREMKQQWWPNWWIVAAVALFVVACAGVQRTVQYYAMGGAAAPGGGGNNDGRITGDPRYPSGVSVDGVLGVFGVGGGGGSRHLNDVVGGHVSGGGVKQRRKDRH